ncbi:GH92 family glycosyl hydrolase [Tessaracoccus massiliensis]|uniref:GH92 family glycosyl hydrolase n=1 Tax=Tessaracoccus massiliensis TaxID=1522311 RepID=UPI000693F009|nr:GH92 family glycosyl hydrolase [Tessaracoccus massiliensis]
MLHLPLASRPATQKVALLVAAAMSVSLGVSVQPAAAAPVNGFHTSFEAEQPQPLLNEAAGYPVNFTGEQFMASSLLSLVDEVSGTGSSPAGESPQMAADANSTTKWLTFAPTATLTYRLSEPASITGYALTSANDAPDRDPRDFLVEGSTDGSTWVTIDTQTGQQWQEGGSQNRFVTKDYDLAERSAEYQYYRLSVQLNNGATIVQLADFDLVDVDREARLLPMVTEVTGGPRSSYTAKLGVGWTGVRSLGYSGRVLVAGAASASNLLFDDLEIAVAAGDELSYKIFPVLDPALTYSSTHVAVDLVFTDGSRLSTSGATDAYGYGASARAQGEGKILFPDQWNSVTVDLDGLAGRTISQILLSYDQAAAPAGTPVAGFVDDITIEQATPRDTSDGLISYVDTRRGTNSTGGFSRGNNLPATAWPNGFNFVTPFTNANTTGTVYSYQQANNAENRPRLQGIGFSHQPSIWMGDRNQLVMMPSLSATPPGGLTNRALAFHHDNEVARPDLYSVNFDNGISTEVTPTDHAAIFRFTFPGDVGSVVVDQGVGQSGLNVSADGRVTGWVDGGSGWPGRTRMFVAGQFDATPTGQGNAEGRASARYAAFDTTADKSVELRIATSFISVDQAQKNLDQETTGRSFEDARAAATAAWNERLSVITDIVGATDEQLVNIYSGLYRLNLYPNSQFENVGTVEAPAYQYASPVSPTVGAATATRTNAQIVDGKVYVNNGFWDTYRTAWPAYALLYPELAEELVDGFVQQYRDGGWIARWSSPGYADLMTGTSSDVAFAEAYLAGAISTELALDAYDAAVKNATARPSSNAVGRKGLERSIFLGFTEATTHESASWGLEGFINDFGIAQMALKLAEDPATPAARVPQLLEEAEYFGVRANRFVEMYNPAAGVFTARNADGSWPYGADFDKKAWGGAFTEASGWTFAFHAPHNVDGMAALYGGRQGLLDELHEFLATQERADRSGIHEAREARDVRLGMLGLSNQIAHHIPYVLAEAGDPSGAQALIRDAQQRLFAGSDIGQGYPGDEDNGEFSAWHIFSALGFYPLQVGSGDYTVGSPLFDSVTLNLDGNPLTITAPGAATQGRVYVAGLSHNGTALTTTTIDGDLIRSGGTLAFTMSDTPTAWGAKDLGEALEVPETHIDASGPDFGALVSGDGTETRPLIDDDMRTAARFTGNEAVLTWTALAGAVDVYQYTLTSTVGEGVSAPVSWTLEGSLDGEAWTQLDARTEQVFMFDTQTRPFTVPEGAGSFSHYRLTIQGAEGMTLGLAEIELFARAAEGGELTLIPADDQYVPVNAELSAPLARVIGGEVGGGSEVTVDFGDGTGPQPGVLTSTGLGGWSIAAPHTFTRPGVYTATISVTDGAGTVRTDTIRITVTTDDTLVGQFNNVCIGDLNRTAANCDGQNYGYFRDKLAADGFIQGQTIAVPGTELTYDLPDIPAGRPDNITGEGQTVRLVLGEGATQISFIGMGTEANRQTVGVLTYSDGTTQEVPIEFGDWVGASGNPAFGNIVLAVSEGRLSGTSPESSVKNTAVYATAPFTLAVDDEGAPKTVVSLTLPEEEGTLRQQGRIHIFAIADDGDRSGFDQIAVTAGTVANPTARVEFEAELATVTSSFGLDDAMATINWGDGTPLEDAAVVDGAVSASHTYAEPGTYTVWVTASDGVQSASASLEIEVDAAPVVVTGISVTTPPTKVDYVAGEELDLAGLVVTAAYSDDSTAVLPAEDLTVSGYDPDTVGGQTVTVTYTSEGETYTDTFTVTVAPALTGIEVTPPTKVDYLAGEELDLTGLLVTGTLSDGSTEPLELDDVEISGYDPDTVGEQTVTVTYTVGEETFTDTFTVTVREPDPEPTEEPTVDPTDEPTVEPTDEPTDEPTVEPTEEPTVEPTEEPTVEPTTPAPTKKPTPEPIALIAPYEVPGHHFINGRRWFTECEEYSQTVRCHTNIWATQVREIDGRFVQLTGWHFNNLTYLPYMTRAEWKGNPLGHTNSWTSTEGRSWRTECDTPATGRDGCRSYILADYVSASQAPDGTWSYAWERGWLFNNMVRFKSR